MECCNYGNISVILHALKDNYTNPFSKNEYYGIKQNLH